jgi:hypothetical protein
LRRGDVGIMEYQEINDSIKEEVLQERLAVINKFLKNRRIYFTLERENTNDIFQYTLRGINRKTNEVESVRILIDKYSTLQYINGFEKALDFFA